jgi:3-deoxy-D-manno-octulosonic acid (KDO) 8-phosphate synthase
MANSAEKVRLAGNPNVMVCERGTMFGYSELITSFLRSSVCFQFLKLFAVSHDIKCY